MGVIREVLKKYGLLNKTYCIDCYYLHRKANICTHKSNKIITTAEETPIQVIQYYKFAQRPEEKNHDYMCTDFKSFQWNDDK